MSKGTFIDGSLYAGATLAVALAILAPQIDAGRIDWIGLALAMGMFVLTVSKAYVCGFIRGRRMAMVPTDAAISAVERRLAEPDPADWRKNGGDPE